MLKDAAAVTQLNEIIRGEISAIETYVQALRSMDDGEEAAGELDVIKKDHIDAVNVLRQRVYAMEGQPDTASGAWGTFVKAMEGAATLLGNKAAIRTLQEGEELGLRKYEEALQDERVPSDTRALIRDCLLPRQRAHIETLERLLDGDTREQPIR